MLILGMISGTSVDGIDAALVEVGGAPPDLDVSLRSFTCVPFTQEQRRQIFELFDPATAPVDKVCQMNFAIGEWFASAALQAIQSAGLQPGEVELIASHGQSAYHCMEPDTPVKSTLQIGEAAVIAERTGITTMADFRVADVAAGGQGAPLVSYVDWLLYRHPAKPRAVQNIGGIGNVTYLPVTPSTELVLSFDTGPGNMLIDYAAQRATDGALTFDRDGLLASQGRVNAALLEQLMAHPYLSQPLPKTAGREQFGVFFARRVWEQGVEQGLAGVDILATLTAFTAASIADGYRRYLPGPVEEVIVGGGGASNPTMLRMLAERLPGVRVLRQEDLGYLSDAKEAIAFAILAYEGLHGRQGNLPTCTFARHPAVLGKLTPGANYRQLLRSLQDL
jgi:anhydro-N-acetylmuramic acid kinase